VEAVGCEDVSRLEFWADSDRCCATHISTQRAGTGLSLWAQKKPDLLWCEPTVGRYIAPPNVLLEGSTTRPE
jgi:hypothetical protein